MATTIRDFVMAQPLFDAHEHLMPLPQFARTVWTPATMASYSAADLTTARGPVPLDAPPTPPTDSDEFRAYFFDAWENARNTGYCRAEERAYRDLFGIEFSRATIAGLEAAVAKTVSEDPEGAYRAALQKSAGIRWAIKDSICRPEDAAPGLYPDFIRLNYRDDMLLCLADRSGVVEREARWNRSLHSLDQLVEGLMQSISDCLATGKVTCFKIGVAYKRDLKFANAGRGEAERAFNRLMQNRSGETHDFSANWLRMRRLSARQLRPLQDYLTHQFIRRATDEGLPIQVHTGYLAGNWNELSNVNPIQLTPVLRQYPRARFDLFHSGWPYQEEMATIGKHYPNAWVNMCWSWTMNPAGMERALDTFLDAVPHNKIFAFGGDTVNPFTAYGYAMQAREGIARVLERRVARGDMDEALARRVARKIMLENGEEFHGLK